MSDELKPTPPIPEASWWNDLEKRYPRTKFPAPRPPPDNTPDPRHVVRYPSHFSAEEREAAARTLLGEVSPPPPDAKPGSPSTADSETGATRRRVNEEYMAALRAEAARMFAPEVAPPPEANFSREQFTALKTAVEKVGVDPAEVNRVLTEYAKALQKGAK